MKRFAPLIALSGLVLVIVSAVVLASMASPTETTTAEKKTAATDTTIAKSPTVARRKFQFDADSVRDRLEESVRYLASDELGGRAVRSPGIALAAAHIAEEYSAAGLKTDLFEAGAYQEFSVSHRLVMGSGNDADLIDAEGRVVDMEVHKDYMPLHWSRPGPFSLPVVFVGYGITDPGIGYDDYANVDVEGKAVVILRREPQQDDAASPFAGKKLTPHAFLIPKLENALDHGAAAVIFCSEHHSRAAIEAEHQKEKGGDAAEPVAEPLLSFSLRGKAPTGKIPVLHCRRDRVDAMYRSVTGTSLAEAEAAIDEQLKPAGRELTGWKIKGAVVMAKERRSFKNVVGLCEGEGELADEAVVIGGHYDHLGGGGMGSLSGSKSGIHNGADDNASGTAITIEVARRWAASSPSPRRKVIFIAFTAEEVGLIGSEQYVAAPLVPMEKTIAMINLDMVGRLRKDHLIVYGTDTGRGLGELLDKAAEHCTIKVSGKASGWGMSDHASFSMRGVPAVHFFTGMHSDYHRPTDDHDKINYEGMQQIAEVAYRFIHELATTKTPPERSTSGGMGSDMDLAALLGISTTPRKKPLLGVIRNSEHQGPGYAVAKVLAKTAASAAGIRPGDVILQVDDAKIKQSSDLPNRLKEAKPGDRVRLVIDRQGTRFELKAKLGG